MKAPRTYEMSARADAVVVTRSRIAREAMALFLEHSFEEVTLARIAQAAGVSHQTVLNHFDSKDGVVFAVAELLKAERLPARYEAEPGDVAAAIHAVVGDYEGMGDANFRWAASGPAVLDEVRATGATYRPWTEAPNRLGSAAVPSTTTTGTGSARRRSSSSISCWNGSSSGRHPPTPLTCWPPWPTTVPTSS